MFKYHLPVRWSWRVKQQAPRAFPRRFQHSQLSQTNAPPLPFFFLFSFLLFRLQQRSSDPPKRQTKEVPNASLLKGAALPCFLPLTVQRKEVHGKKCETKSAFQKSRVLLLLVILLFLRRQMKTQVPKIPKRCRCGCGEPAKWRNLPCCSLDAESNAQVQR